MSFNVAMLEAMQAEGLDLAACIRVLKAGEKKTDATGAERQARYRERKRNAVTVTPVTDQKENTPKPPKENTSPKENPPKGGQKKGAEDEIVEAWNVMAERHDLPGVQRLNPTRRKALGCRLREHPPDEIVAAIAEVPRNPHWMGEAGWKGNFDSFLRPGRIQSFLEAAAARGPREVKLTPEDLERRAELWDKIDKPEDAARCRQEAAKLREAA